MNYSIVIGNTQYGPYSETRLQEFARRGKLKGNMTLVDENGHRQSAKILSPHFFQNQDYVDLSYLADENYSDNQSNNTYSNNNSYTSSNIETWTMIGADGKTYGPYTREILQSFVRDRRITRNTVLFDSMGRQVLPSLIVDFNVMGNYGFCENDSGNGACSILPMELQGYNWGAFLLGPFWSIFNKTYIGLLCFVPYIGCIMYFVLLFKGNEWAWQNRRWNSVYDFIECQKAWRNWGIGLVVFNFFVGFYSIFGILSSFH